MPVPHQAFVLLTVAGLSLLITLGILVGIFNREKQHQASNTDEH
jgi:NADH:ubiquinone oxidoreductase subunit K